MFIGNIFVYFQFQGETTIKKETRTIVISVLSGIAVVGIVIMAMLPKVRRSDDSTDEIVQGPVEALKGAAKLFCTKRMLLLVFTFLYTGLFPLKLNQNKINHKNNWKIITNFITNFN